MIGSDLRMDPRPSPQRIKGSGCALVPLYPQWPRLKSFEGGSIGRHHWLVTEKFCRLRAPFLKPPPSSLPRFAASDDGAFEHSALPARLIAWHAARKTDGRCDPSAQCHLPTGVHRRRRRPRPWLRELWGSLHRGGQDLGTRWTADGRSRGGCACPQAAPGWRRRHPAGIRTRSRATGDDEIASGYSVTTLPIACLRVGAGNPGVRKGFAGWDRILRGDATLSQVARGKVPETRLGQSSSDNKMVTTGSPWSPGLTISFSVVIAALVDLPSRSTR